MNRLKRRAQLTLLMCTAATAAIAWLAGVDVVGFGRALAVSIGEALLKGLQFPIQLPVWGVVLLTIPSLWVLASIQRGLRSGWERFRGRSRQRPRLDPVATEPAVLEPLEALQAETQEPVEKPSREPVEAPEPEVAEPPASTDYCEDVQLGVIWRWNGPPASAELRAYCPECDAELEPRSAGSLSRGLFCRHCNRFQTAGLHPSEITPRVTRALEVAAQSGAWRHAPQRVAELRERAEHGSVGLPVPKLRDGRLAG